MASSPRLSAQDATFLYLEGPNTPYHVSSLMLFDGGSIAYQEVLDLFDQRLHLVPRFRQKLAEVPLGFARPLWTDDEDFDLRYHVRAFSLPAPGTEAQLIEACSHLVEQHLSRSRPLWECYVIDGLEGDRAAVLTKTHHALVDGVSGVDLTALLLDPARESEPVAPLPYAPRAAPSRRRMLADAIRERLGDPARAIRALPRRPRDLAHAARDVASGFGALAWSGLHPAPPSPLNVPIGPNRRLAIVRASLDDFKMIKQHLDGTVNDVVLTVVAGALRTWLLLRGEPVAALELKAMVPVSIRHADERGQAGNRVSTIIAPLALWEPDAVHRFERIREGTAKAKASHQVVGAELLVSLSGHAAPTLLSQIAKVQNVQRFFNLSVTNIPGPSQPLYVAGHTLLDLFPFTPLAGNMALIVAVISYAGQMEFGLTADADALPDLDVLARSLERAIVDLKSHSIYGAALDRRPA